MAREMLTDPGTAYDGVLVAKNDPFIVGWLTTARCDFTVQPGNQPCGFPRIVKKDYHTQPPTLTYICTDKPVQHQRDIPNA